MSDRPQFDHGKANILIEELQGAKRALTEQTKDRVGNAKTLRQHWKGHHADQFFGTEVPRITKQSDALINHLNTIISALTTAVARASAAETDWASKQPQLLPTGVPTPNTAPPVSSTPSPRPGPAPTPPTTHGG